MDLEPPVEGEVGGDPSQECSNPFGHAWLILTLRATVCATLGASQARFL